MKHIISRISKFRYVILLQILCISILSSSVLEVTAQNKTRKKITITGQVTDAKGETLIGATVWVIGEQKGAATDFNGNFKLTDVYENSILKVTYIGMTEKHIAVNSKTNIQIILENDTKLIDEVVVIGYGSLKRSDITGSTAGVNMNKVETQMNGSLEGVLKGRISGVKVSSDNSPGGSISIQIRGSNSMLGGTEPLYVVDGFPLEPIVDAQGNNDAGESQIQSSMSFINPDDIENIEILKDASASAIYGARGANGVVLITTKQGKQSGSKITYNFHNEISTIAKKLPVMNAMQWATNMNQREINRYYLESTAPSTYWSGTIAPIDLPYDGVKAPLPWEMPINTDWQDAIYRTANTTNHSLQIQGSTASTNYSLNLGVRQQQGIILSTDYNRYSINSNIQHSINKKLKITNNLNSSYANSSGATVSNGEVFGNRGLITSALLLQPIFLLDETYQDPNEDDEYASINNNQRINNPYTMATKLLDDKKYYSIIESVGFSYNISKDLILSGKLGVNYNSSERAQYWPRTTTRGKTALGVAAQSSNILFKSLSEVRLNYTHKIGKHQNIDLMVATTYESNDRKEQYNKYENFPSDDLTYYQVQSALSVFPTEMNYLQYKLNSYISRLNYKIRNKYLFTATLRADGSTRFAQNNKWGLFPSAAFAWRVSEEKFLENNNLVNNLKMRISAGRTGSESGIDPYRSLGILGQNQYTFKDVTVPGFIESNIPNPNLSWETTDQYDFGVDATLFNSRLLLTLDLYYKYTSNLLQNVPLPPSFGYGSKIMNLGEIENKGIELDITVPILKMKDISWNVGANIAVNRNKLVKIGGGREYILGPNVGSFRVNRFIEGEPLGVFWGLKTEGVIKTWDEALATTTQPKAVPGEYKFANLYTDDAVQTINDNDMTIIGDPNPDFTFGFNTNFHYKHVDVNMLINGQIGGDIYWNDHMLMIAQNQNYNALTEVLSDSWIAPMQYTFAGPDGKSYTIGSAQGNIANATLPSARTRDGLIAGSSTVYRNSIMNSSGIFDGSFVKLSSISTSYSFNFNKVIKELKMTVSASNLLTLTKYPGYDPESSSFVKSPMRQGIDLGSYPSSRSFAFSLTASF
ncbi:MAG: TonB-dependent receptor [Bacteroidales bacterium]|nr:TonB-dependent receptor [Bacteroidales bacterium]